MIKVPATPEAKHAVAMRIAAKVGSTAIDAARSPQHAAMRQAEMSAQADFLVKLYEINGWNLNCLFFDTASAIADAKALEQTMTAATHHDAAEDSHA
jgi:hypothetical protein